MAAGLRLNTVPVGFLRSSGMFPVTKFRHSEFNFVQSFETQNDIVSKQLGSALAA